MNPDPRIALLEIEIQKTLHLQALVERLLDGFVDAPRVTCIPAPSFGLTLNSRKRKASALHSDANLLVEQPLEEQPEPATLEAPWRKP